MNKQELINKIKQLEGLTHDERAELINLLNTKKKYGLIWEDKPEDVEEELRTNLPVLREVVEKRILAADNIPTSDEHKKPDQYLLFKEEDNDNNLNPDSKQLPPNHILIEGDNLQVLTALTFTHEGLIDVIYIDPPYNTGNKEDFIYNDHYVDKEDSFRHSKWLSFMSKRLYLAKRLLKDDGVIYCSIGDDEIAQLTLLFNQIFTENNKLGIIARVAKTAGDKGSYFAPSKDYIIVYTNNKILLRDFKDGVDESLFKKVETIGQKKGEKYRDDVAFYQSSLDTRPNQRYFIKCPDGSYVVPPGESMPEKIEDGAKAIPINGDGVWRWANETFFDFEKRQLLVFKKTNKSPLLDENGNRAKWNIYTKSYLNDRSEKGSSPRDYLDEFINRKGADLIKQYDIDFSYSKPYELVQHLIKITNKSNDIVVLDFFAGSGTTLQAVMSLNKIDKGNRTCIITNNNESKICDEVTFPRCERTIKPYINSKGKEMPFYPNNNLRYYKTDFVASTKNEPNKRLLAQCSTELLCIKEDCYSELTESLNFNPVQCRIFNNERGKYMIVVYHNRKQWEVYEQLIIYIKTLENISEFIKLYAFTSEKETLLEDFVDVADKIEALPLPEAIYNAYRNTFRTLKLDKKTPVVNLGDSEETEIENELIVITQDEE
jgi:adenine-specific DNA-methyltransferase